jgi:hypothetical protein
MTNFERVEKLRERAALIRSNAEELDQKSIDYEDAIQVAELHEALADRLDA